jgi:hypothetical protein
VGLEEAGCAGGGSASRGIAHHHLAFDGRSAPPDRAVAAFLAAADAAEGAVAVRCGAEPGGAATLIALYMMRTHGFGARAAVGWQHVVRPGSVVGAQQDYLCTVEGRAARMPAVLAAVRRGQAGAVPRGFRSAFVPAAGRR